MNLGRLVTGCNLRLASQCYIKPCVSPFLCFPYSIMPATSTAAEPSVVHSSALSKQLITVNLPELTDSNFLDTLLPAGDAPKPLATNVAIDIAVPSNPMMDALKSTSHQTFTANAAPAYDSTGDANLDAFQFLNQHSYSPSINQLLEKSWEKNTDLTLRIIWNLRSIHDGKSQKEVFYRAYGTFPSFVANSKDSFILFRLAT